MCCPAMLAKPPNPPVDDFLCIVFAVPACDTRLSLLKDPPPPADTRHTLQADRPTVARGRCRTAAGWSAAAHSFQGLRAETRPSQPDVN